MDLSIIIVSYNAKEFLKNCIDSIYKSTSDISFEIVVVDNHSIDGSKSMIQNEFPHILYIENGSNRGFAKACNQGIRISKGKYVLLLNPDTLISEDTLAKCFEFSEQQSELTAIGVKMFDGKGSFLPESKRGFPFPATAFYKMTGIYKLFPNSKYFNYYYLGHLSADEVQDIDVLTGAFFWVPIKILEKTGLLDEQFFMYGEDIDLSYRIQKAGFPIKYLPSTSIVHYKGASTQKKSIIYLKRFYKAMIQFSEKHRTSGNINVLTYMLKLAIYIHAIFAGVKQFFTSVSTVFLDVFIFFCGMSLLKEGWEYLYFGEPTYFRNSPVYWNLLGYALIWGGSIYIHEAYTKYKDSTLYIKSVFWGLIVILVLYSILPVDWRTSRVLIFLSFIWVTISGLIVRELIYRKFLLHHENDQQPNRIVVIGRSEEIERISGNLKLVNWPISIEKELIIKDELTEDLLQSVIEIVKFKNKMHIDEFWLCLKNIPTSILIQILTVTGKRIPLRVVGDNSLNILGSQMDGNPGVLNTISVQYQIKVRLKRFQKRLLELIMIPIFILLSPLKKVRKNKSWLWVMSELLLVGIGRKLLISYHPGDPLLYELPALKPGIYTCDQTVLKKDNEHIDLHYYNVQYALHYTYWKDIKIIMDLIVHPD